LFGLSEFAQVQADQRQTSQSTAETNMFAPHFCSCGVLH
jgi:hypothetical protein